MKCKLGVGKCHIYFDNSVFFLFWLFRRGSNTAEEGRKQVRVQCKCQKRRGETLIVCLFGLFVCEVSRRGKKRTNESINHKINQL